MWLMVSPLQMRRDPCGRTLVLILVAVISVTVFYYQARVDTIAVINADGGAQVVTGREVGFFGHNLAALLLVGLLPLLAARLWCGLGWRAMGLGWGRWRRGLGWLAVGLPLAVLVARLSAQEPAMQSVYPLERFLPPGPGPFLRHVAGQLVYYTAWELLFRGVLLFGLEKRLGFGGANVVQTALSTIAHFGKPLPETLAAIPAGLAFGGIARHTRSVWYVVAIHLTVGAALDWFLVR